jgi:hypothetical protein
MYKRVIRVINIVHGVSVYFIIDAIYIHPNDSEGERKSRKNNPENATRPDRPRPMPMLS